MFIHDTALKFHISDQDWYKTTQKTWSITNNQANFIYSQEQTAMFSLKKKKESSVRKFLCPQQTVITQRVFEVPPETGIKALLN